MATVSNALQISDGMTPALTSIQRALSVTSGSFRSLEAVSNKALSALSIRSTQVEYTNVNIAIYQQEQAIEKVAQKQEELNSNIKDGGDAANGFSSKIMGLASKLTESFSPKSIMSMADGAVVANARLSLINDGLQTTDELHQKLYQSAQRSRSSYESTAAVVTKIGTVAKEAFGSNDEMIVFAEQMSKQFQLSGLSVQDQTSAMEQLVGSMSSGIVQGEEFSSVMANAPYFAQSLAKELGVSESELMRMSSEGMITSDVIKSALFNAAEETNTKFAELPVTFEQLWTRVVNALQNTFMPLFLAVASGAQMISDNWSVIAPFIYGIVAALVLYNVVAGVTNGIKAFQELITWRATQATAAQSAATFMAAVQQNGLNAALYACPLTWIILLVIGLIVVIYAVIAVINKLAGTSYSATGVIAAVFLFLCALILNSIIGVFNAIIQYMWSRFVEPWIGIIEWVLNVFNGGFDSFGGAVANLIGQIISWFLSLGKIVTKIIDAIFGTNWTSGLSSLQDNVLAWGKNENAVTIDRKAPAIEYRVEYSDALDAGYKFGEGLGKKFDLGNFKGDDSLENISSGVSETATNTKDINNSVNMSGEDLKYMRDLAEQDIINRFTTAEVKVEMGGINNNINSNMDLDGIVSYLGEKLTETLSTVAEGVPVLV